MLPCSMLQGYNHQIWSAKALENTQDTASFSINLNASYMLDVMQAKATLSLSGSYHNHVRTRLHSLFDSL